MYTIKLERGGLGIAKRGDGSSICKEREREIILLQKKRFAPQRSR